MMGVAHAPAAEKFDTDPKHKLPRPDTKAADLAKPVKVFILMGQSNMVGMGDIGPETTRGTLAYLTKKEKKYPFLLMMRANGRRKDVYYYDARVKKGGMRAHADREQRQVHRAGTGVRLRHGPGAR